MIPKPKDPNMPESLPSIIDNAKLISKPIAGKDATKHVLSVTIQVEAETNNRDEVPTGWVKKKMQYALLHEIFEDRMREIALSLGELIKCATFGPIKQKGHEELFARISELIELNKFAVPEDIGKWLLEETDIKVQSLESFVAQETEGADAHPAVKLREAQITKITLDMNDLLLGILKKLNAHAPLNVMEMSIVEQFVISRVEYEMKMISQRSDKENLERCQFPIKHMSELLGLDNANVSGETMIKFLSDLVNKAANDLEKKNEKFQGQSPPNDPSTN